MGHDAFSSTDQGAGKRRGPHSLFISLVSRRFLPLAHRSGGTWSCGLDPLPHVVAHGDPDGLRCAVDADGVQLIQHANGSLANQLMSTLLILGLPPRCSCLRSKRGRRLTGPKCLV